MRMKAHCLATSNNARQYQLPTTDSIFYGCCRRWSLKCVKVCVLWSLVLAVEEKSEKRLSFLFSLHVVGRGVNTVVIPTHKIQLNTYFKNLLQKFIKNITPNKENRFEPQKHRFAINRSQNESTKNRFFFNKNNRFLNNRIDSAHH
jgi:hypothetical protein